MEKSRISQPWSRSEGTKVTPFYRWGTSVFVVVLLVAIWGLFHVGCQDRFCRTNYECSGYKCDEGSVICFSSCETNDQCDTSRGYVCQEGSCKCGAGDKQYCQRECFSNRDCERISGCLRITREGGKAKSELTCSCQDPCEQEGALCLGRNNSNNNASGLGTTPAGAPKQCIANSNSNNSGTGEGDDDDDEGGGESSGESSDEPTANTEANDAGNSSTPDDSTTSEGSAETTKE